MVNRNIVEGYPESAKLFSEPELLENIVNHPMTDIAIEGFDKDWNSVYGDKTILDL